MITEPPISDVTLSTLNRFTTRWIRWFTEVYKSLISLFSSVSDLQSVAGWAYYDDSQYTSGSPLNINNTTTQITINGLGSSTETSFLPLGASFFDTSTSKITPETLGESYLLRFDYKAISATNNVQFNLQINIGGMSTVLVYDQTLSIIKGINTEQRYSIAIPIYCLSTFLANGGVIQIQTVNNINFYDFGLFIGRTFKQL